MTASTDPDGSDPNRNALWGRVIVEELVHAGVSSVCLAPGSRSTPLVVAAHRHDDVTLYSHLDERSAAFFALGRAKRTGVPSAVVTTSGTAAANLHPAVIEAFHARVPLLVVTADRPPDLRDSGSNQTIDQVGLFGSALRWFADLPEPEADARKVRSLRTTVDRAVATTTGTPPGPVHLNVPFRKPLEPRSVPDDVPAAFGRHRPLAAWGRDGAYVEPTTGHVTLDDPDLERLTRAIDRAERGLIVAGPSERLSAATVSSLGRRTGFPILADPLSGLRYGPHTSEPGVTVVGGYDSWLDPVVVTQWPEPDTVLRFGAEPTSTRLRDYLQRVDGRQYVVDPAGEWREDTFTATDLVVADPNWLAGSIVDGIEGTSDDAGWRDRFATAEARYWEVIDGRTTELFEGAVVAATLEGAPDSSVIFVSNSMPVRDLDRFARPHRARTEVFGNRGASGIDGIVSSALGVGSAGDEPLVLVTGDLAFYHDMNGLLAVDRFDVDVTIVLLNNDGGGIFHMLPIERFDPPFTDRFKTPHGLDFEPVADLYGLEYRRTDSLSEFREHYRRSVSGPGGRIIEVVVDGEASHRRREAIHEEVRGKIGG